MESGEGIERGLSDGLGGPSGRLPWNPVKELKGVGLYANHAAVRNVVESGEGIERLNGSPSRRSTSSHVESGEGIESGNGLQLVARVVDPSWNPVKELKGAGRDEVGRNDVNAVESGEGIERRFRRGARRP